MMLRTILERSGVDYDQWRHLLWASIKIDIRSSAMRRGGRRRRADWRALAGQLLLYAIIGIMFGFIVLANKCIFFTSLVVISYIMVMIGAQILLEYNTILISPDDYPVLSPLPVSSRTYFAVKVANILFLTSLSTTAMGLPSVAAYGFTLNFRPLLVLAAFAAIYLSSITTALLMVAIYAAVMRYVQPKLLKSILAYFQLLLSFLIFGMWILFPNLIKSEGFQGMEVERVLWHSVLPPVWFSSFFDLAQGIWKPAVFLSLLAGFAAFLGSAYLAMVKIAGQYTERLAEAAVLPGPRPKAARTRRLRIALPFLLTAEDKVVSRLIVNQFRHDNKFKMAVLGIIPLVFFYLYMGTREGRLADPFQSQGFQPGDSWVLYITLVLFPFILKNSVSGSDAYQASWVFFVTPASKRNLVLSVKKLITLYFALPFLLFMGAIFQYHFRNLIHVVLHIVCWGVLVNIFMQINFFIDPQLPFSRPLRRGESSRRMIGAFILMPLLFAAIPLLSRAVVYRSMKTYMVGLGVLLLASALLQRALHKRIDRTVGKLEFLG